MATKLYVAGPMTGYDDFNFPLFDMASKEARSRGYQVVSPADIDRQHGLTGKSPADHIDLCPIIIRDVEALVDCDGMLLLPGWENSRGAVAEVSVALWRKDFEFFTYPDFQPIEPQLGIIKPKEFETGFEPRRIIGLTGFAGSGKDAAAEGLKRDGWHVIGFADPLYKMALVLNPLIWYYVFPVRLSWLVERFGWTEAKKVPGVRKYLQKLGTEAVRENLGRDTWVRAMKKRLSPFSDYVITNVRFENEAQAIWSLGGFIIGVDRPGIGPANSHISEHGKIKRNATIVNDGSEFDLREKLRQTVMDLEEQHGKQAR